MGIFLAYVFYFVAASASPLQRRWLATKEKDNNGGQIDFAFQTALIVACLSLVFPLFSPFLIQGNRMVLFGLAVLCGLFGAGYWVSLFSAQRHVEAGVTNIVLNIYTLVTILLASLFLNEKLTLLQLFGTILLLVGMVIVSKKHQIGKLRFDKNFILVLISGILLGVMLTTERALMKITGFTAGTMMSWWAQFIFLGFALLVFGSKCNYKKKDIAITGGLRFLQSLSWVLLLLLVGNLSLVSAVTTFKVVIIFIVAAILLKENEDIPRKTIGSLIALAGLILMR